MRTNDLVSVMGGRVDVIAVVLALWTVFETFRTLYAWRWPAEVELGSDALAAQKIVGLTDELNDARRHRNIELVILGVTGALQVPVWIVAWNALEPWRWLCYAFMMGSLLLVESRRRRAFRRLQSAHARAIQLVDKALALKAERSSEGAERDRR